MRNISRRSEGLREWWLVLAIFVVSAFVVALPPYRVNLFFYLLPTLLSAYHFGRRKAVLTAVCTVCLVVASVFLRDLLLSTDFVHSLSNAGWYELIVWAVVLIGCGWAAGELFGQYRQRHEGYVEVLRHLIIRDKRDYDHVRRLAHYSSLIAAEMRLPQDRIEVVKAAALLHDINTVDVDRSVFRDLAGICDAGASNEGDKHAMLSEVMPIVVAERVAGARWQHVPVEARIVSLANEFDNLTTPRQRRTGLPYTVARNMLEREAGKKFDPTVVRAFTRAYDRGAFFATQQLAASNS